MENRNQSIASRPRKANLVSPLCSGRGVEIREPLLLPSKKCNVLKRAVGFLKNVLWNPSSREVCVGGRFLKSSEFGKCALLAADAS